MNFKFRISYIFVFVILLINSKSYCQLAISTAMTPAQLVQNVLLGSGVTVSNITYAGGVNAKGSFTNGSTTNLGLNSGVILSTGVVTQIANPQTYFMNTNLGLPGDANLNAIANGGTSHDACVLSFDFVPLSDTVRFRYVFGSEEYPDYVCSQYYDVFGFFISGQNPSGGNYTNYNIALIPGTALPVGINSVNNGSAGSGYNGSNCVSLAYAGDYVDNVALNGATICFGGFTTPLTAICHVVPCQTYHVKLAVGDVFNGLYDSGVFLEANSFSANTYNVSTSYSNSTFGNNAVEGCSNGFFSFTLPAPATSAFTINYTISGSATNGADYPAVPNSVTIPAGQDSTTIIISPSFDGISEGTETVILTYMNGCNSQSDTIFIRDNPLLTVAGIDSTNICPGSSATLTLTTAGGIPPYTFAWNNGAGNADSAIVSPPATTTYIVTVTDNCSQTATHSFVVTVGAYSATAASTNESCGQANGTATVTPIGSCSQGWTYSWNTVPPQTAAIATNLAAGTYTVTISCGGCTASATAIVTNTSGPSVNITGIANTVCGNANGDAVATATGNNPPYNYSWSNGQSGTNLQNVTAGNYTVTASDAVGCTATNSVVITNTSGPSATVASMAATCNLLDGSATVTATGGQGTYSYLWSNGQTTATITGLASGIYTVSVSDSNCTTVVTANITQTPGPMAGFSEHPSILTTMDGPVNFLSNSGGSIVSWQWNFGDGTTGSGTNVQHSYPLIGNYAVTLVVTDNNGCTDTVTDTVKVKDIFTLYIPSAFTPNHDGKNDIFFVQGLSVDPDNFEMLIFDRWGNLIFSTRKWNSLQSEGWNGTKDNKGTTNEVVLGVYVYHIKLKELDGPSHQYIGRIALIP